MFSNIIFFISALIISVLYQQDPGGQVQNSTSAAGLAASFIIFYLVSSKAFKRIHHGAEQFNLAVKYNKNTTRLSIFAIIIFTINIYIFELPDIFSDIYLVKKIPTFLPCILISVFTMFMWILWGVSHRWFQVLNDNNVSLKEFLQTQSGFALPSVFPWFVISFVFDVLTLLPFNGLTEFINTIFGQILYSFCLVILISLFIPVLIKKFWKCSDLDDQSTIDVLRDLTEKTGVKYREALVWPLFGGNMITAGVIGLFQKFRFILVTPGFNKYLNDDEKSAVIAHEFGHIKKMHLFWYLFIFMGFIVVSYSVIEPAAFIFNVYSPESMSSFFNSHIKFASLSAASFLVVTFVLYFRFIFGYFMRNFERQADAFAFKTAKAAYPLVSTFKKISMMSAEPPDKPNWHHFSIKERIDFLLECEEDKSLVKKHDQSVNKFLSIYFVIMAVLILMGVWFNESGKNYFYINKIEKLMEAGLNEPVTKDEALRYIGDLFVENKNEEKAIDAYLKSLSLNPDSPETLNNLAWIYISSTDESIKDSKKGLLLAKKAFAVSGENSPPYLLDTIAHGYFQNGDFEKSCFFSKKAYEKSGSNEKIFYKAQMEKLCPGGY